MYKTSSNLARGRHYKLVCKIWNVVKSTYLSAGKYIPVFRSTCAQSELQRLTNIKTPISTLIKNQLSTELFEMMSKIHTLNPYSYGFALCARK